jgi:HNH endonuclease
MNRWSGFFCLKSVLFFDVFLFVIYKKKKRMEQKTKRSSRWYYWRKKHLNLEPTCQWCGATEHLQVHHIVPFHIDKSLELTPSNLITLCEVPTHNCHRRYGHYGNWALWNPKIRVQCIERQQFNQQKNEQS